MGQYYVIANITKKEYINPSHLGSGIKLMEFAMDGQSAMTGLAILLASSNGQGGGDLHLPAGSEFAHIPGRWAGDRIVVAGDYDDMPSSPGYKVYDLCRHVSALQELAEAAGEENCVTAKADCPADVRVRRLSRMLSVVTRRSRWAVISRRISFGAVSA